MDVQMPRNKCLGLRNKMRGQLYLSSLKSWGLEGWGVGLIIVSKI